MYKVKILNKSDYHKFPDGLTFNYIMLIYSILKKHRIKFFPIFGKKMTKFQMLSYLIMEFPC